MITLKPSLTSLGLIGMGLGFGLGCGGSEGPARTLHFAATVGDQPFACGQSYAGLGTTGTTWEPRDLRLYVHDLRLVDDAGAETEVELVEDGVFVGQGVALLDFEDRTGSCSNGTEETHAQLRFIAPEGNWKGLRFRVGVPEALNHADASTAKSPLNLSTLFWSWQGGYKFLRLDGKTTGLPTGHSFHLGSTGCSGEPVTCTSPNRIEVAFDAFDADAERVVFDVKTLFEGSNLDANADGTPPGCMSGPATDPDCGPIHDRVASAFRQEAR